MGSLIRHRDGRAADDRQQNLGRRQRGAMTSRLSTTTTCPVRSLDRRHGGLPLWTPRHQRQPRPRRCGRPGAAGGGSEPSTHSASGPRPPPGRSPRPPAGKPVPMERAAPRTGERRPRPGRPQRLSLPHRLQAAAPPRPRPCAAGGPAAARQRRPRPACRPSPVRGAVHRQGGELPRNGAARDTQRPVVNGEFTVRDTLALPAEHLIEALLRACGQPESARAQRAAAALDTLPPPHVSAGRNKPRRRRRGHRAGRASRRAR